MSGGVSTPSDLPVGDEKRTWRRGVKANGNEESGRKINTVVGITSDPSPYIVSSRNTVWHQNGYTAYRETSNGMEAHRNGIGVSGSEDLNKGIQCSALQAAPSAPASPNGINWELSLPLRQRRLRDKGKRMKILTHVLVIW